MAEITQDREIIEYAIESRANIITTLSMQQRLNLRSFKMVF